jgi:hypothetical protein
MKVHHHPWQKVRETPISDNKLGKLIHACHPRKAEDNSLEDHILRPAPDSNLSPSLKLTKQQKRVGAWFK